jgi:hypothetical protein
MQLEELSNISDNLAMMPDPALQQFAQMHKTDPYMVSLALSESNRRKKLRIAAQGQAGAMPQPRVVDAAIQGMQPTPVAQTQLPENQGIAQIAAPNIQRMADGGIAGYEDDEEGMATGGMGGMFNFAQQSEPVVRMAGGGMAPYIPGYKDTGKVVDYRQAIIDEAKRQGVPPEVALQISGVESNFDPKAKPIDPKTGKPRSSATSFFQVIDETFKNLGGKAEKRTDPMENIRVGVKALAQNQAALTKQLGRAPEASELYTTHFLGTPTGAKLLSADPSTPISAFLDKADPKNKEKILTANPEVLGGKKTVGDVLAWTQKKMAPILTSAIPIGSAQAEQVPQAKPAAAAPALPEGLTEKEIEALSKPAFLTPSSGKGRKEGKMSEAIKSGEAPRQMMLGAGDLPYNIAGGLFDISHDVSKVFGNKSAPPALGSRGMKDFATKYLGREPDPTDPTLKGFRTAGELGSMVVDPMSTTRKVAQTAEGLEALAQAQRVKANLAAEKTATPVGMRLEPPRTEPPVMVADSQGRVMPADTRARVEQAFADEAAVGAEAGKAMALEKQAAAYPGAAQRAEMLKTAEMADKARGTALAAKVGDETTMRNLGIITERPEVGESVSGSYDTTMPKPKAIIEAAKDATPAKERKGFGDDDLLMLGLSLMANKSPNFMTALGEAGIQTLGAKREREKGESEKEYRQALAEQAKRPSNEVQLIEKYRDDPKFAEAYDKFAQSKREPQTRESLLKSWAASPFLQTTYTNPEDYIKMMSAAASGGAPGSQLNASDQSLIQKYLR